MSNKNQETIADIVSEVRRVAYNVAVADANTLNGWRPALCLSMLSDRIEASHNRECEQLNAEIEAMSKFNDEINAQMKECASECENLKKENARLLVIVSGATVAEGNLREEIEQIRKLVKELADELSKFHAWEEARALVAKAMEAIGGAE